MGQHFEFIRQDRRVSESGYESRLSLYRAGRCPGCPLRGGYHKLMKNRHFEVNHHLNTLKQAARDLLMSDAGLELGLKALTHNQRKQAALTLAKFFSYLFSASKPIFTPKLNIVYSLRMDKVA